MKKRAAASGGKVLDAAGNDITDAKPTHKVGVGAWGAPKDMEKQVDPLEWVDKSVQGFQKQVQSFPLKLLPYPFSINAETSRLKHSTNLALSFCSVF
jgi:hypothetical protein